MKIQYASNLLIHRVGGGSPLAPRAPVLVLAGGLGCFEPRKPPIDNIGDYEDRGVEYIIRDPEFYRDKRVVIAGGGDSALDWTIYLADIAREIVMIHRRTEFRGAPDSVEKVQELVREGDDGTLQRCDQGVVLKGIEDAGR